jgi:hypothetical protein
MCWSTACWIVEGLKLRQLKTSMVLLCVGVVVSGCANVSSPARKAAASRGPVCETASGHATSFGQSTARLYAQASMRQQAGEIRGELLQSGLRRIRVGRATGDCQPLPGAFRGIGLAHCRSYASVCGQ